MCSNKEQKGQDKEKACSGNDVFDYSPRKIYKAMKCQLNKFFNYLAEKTK